MQNTEATQIFVRIEHSAYGERENPSGVHSLCSMFPAKWSSQGMAFSGDAKPRRSRADPHLQPNNRIFWWLGRCKGWWDLHHRQWCSLENNGQSGVCAPKSTPQSITAVFVLTLAYSTVLYIHRHLPAWSRKPRWRSSPHYISLLAFITRITTFPFGGGRRV